MVLWKTIINRHKYRESSFFVALCHALYEGENELTAMDAVWLGLVDTIRADIS